MTSALDLEQELGGAWCVTVARDVAPATMMDAMGVAPESVKPMNFQVEMVDGELETVLLHEVPTAPAWTLAVEFNAVNGFNGWRPDVLAKLTAGNGTACVLTFTTDDLEACYAENGVVVTELQPPRTYRRQGAAPDRFVEQLARAGFPIDDNDELTGRAATLAGTQWLSLVLEVMTGVVLDETAFQDPWTGGVIRPDARS